VADDTEFLFVTTSVRRAARLQREYVEAFLETADNDLISIGKQFAGLCDRIEEAVDDYEERHTSSDSIDRKLILNSARELLVWTRDLQHRRAWLDAATKPPIDLGSFYYLSSLAKAVIRDDSELTVVAVHEGSYATVVNPFRVPTESQEDAIVLVALVPHRETNSGLLHPLLAHEVGHGVAKVHGFTEQLQSQLVSNGIDQILERGAQLEAEQSKRERQDTTKTGPSRTAQEERAVLDKRFGAWIEEIFCDSVATSCLGATYLFSFATEVLPDDIDVAGSKHPPTRQRVRLILEHLDRTGWGELLDSEVPSFMHWVRRVASDKPTPQRPGDDALLAAINLAGHAIQNAVDTHIGERAVAPDKDALSTVAELLRERVPPAQHDDGKAIDRPIIVVGCWLTALKSRGGTIDALADAVDSPELAELLPYALELSVIVDRWQTA
jgi:hypothetical protein